MNVGLLFAFRNPPRWRVPWNEFYETQLGLVKLSEDLGYDTAWLTEHHFSEDGYSPSLLPIAANVAARTERIRIGTFLILLPLQDAIRVAEDAATVDILSNGRLDLGVGQGYVPFEFDTFGVDRKQRGSLLEEGVEVIRGLWTEDRFSYRGAHYRFEDVHLEPRPVQDPPPIWIGARGKRAVERAARLGCHFLGVSEPGGQDLYDETLRSRGEDPARWSATQLQWAYVAPSADEAWADCQEHLHYMLYWYARWQAAADDAVKGIVSDGAGVELAAAEKLRDTLDPNIPGLPLVGTPEHVAEGLKRLASTIRMTHLVVGMNFPGLDPAKSRQSMELFAKEVIPAIR